MKQHITKIKTPILATFCDGITPHISVNIIGTVITEYSKSFRLGFLVKNEAGKEFIADKADVFKSLCQYRG